MILSDANKINKRSVGVIVDEEFFRLDQANFIRAACPDQEFPEVYARWRDPTRRPQELPPEMPFSYCLTELQEYVVHLFGFPEALSRTCFLGDLQFPMELQELGFVVIVDLEALSQYENETRLDVGTRDYGRSALVWALTHNLPFVVVAKAQDASPTYSTEELRSIFGLSADVPICWCSSSFDSELVQRVLRNLLAQFEAS